MASKLFDASEWNAVFERLKGPLKESLARRMAIAGARVLSAEAEANARIADNKEGVPRTGRLANNIYHAYEKRSPPGEFAYSVSWRRGPGKANHGHLIEFGHWRNFAVFKGKDGEWYSDKNRPLAAPVWVAARPFLRPAFDAKRDDVMRVMIQTGREEFPKLIEG